MEFSRRGGQELEKAIGIFQVKIGEKMMSFLSLTKGLSIQNAISNSNLGVELTLFYVLPLHNP